ncbi:hypothetical protein [Caldimonas sp. KR1-144]|uniref:hypothetical protein n=1 Tax=Caldimonas sp. KR1-144 TaxID=3400911 RepID=UPI003C0183EE
MSHIVSLSGGSDGLGFVVTSNMAKRLLFDEPTVWSGLEGYLLAGELARALNVPAPGTGLLVQRVAHGSPAEMLGVRGGSVPVNVGEEQLTLGGDIILAVEGIALGEPEAYERIRRRLMDVRAAGQSLRMQVLRAGRVVELSGQVRR